MPRRRKSLIGMAFDAARASQDAAVTVAARLPIIAKASQRSAAPPSAEMQLMVSEKAEAAMQGAFAASMAMGQLWTRAMFGGLRTPMDVAHGLAGVADAAMKPARITVRANARRLSRKRA